MESLATIWGECIILQSEEVAALINIARNCVRFEVFTAVTMNHAFF
jgi:hypothetical protein